MRLKKELLERELKKNLIFTKTDFIVILTLSTLFCSDIFVQSTQYVEMQILKGLTFNRIRIAKFHASQCERDLLSRRNQPPRKFLSFTLGIVYLVSYVQVDRFIGAQDRGIRVLSVQYTVHDIYIYIYIAALSQELKDRADQKI